jgi:hypothetical protein
VGVFLQVPRRAQNRVDAMLKKITTGANRRLNDKKPLKFKCVVGPRSRPASSTDGTTP